MEAAHAEVKAVYTNKAPGGVAYRCSFRVTEAAYVIERVVDLLARKLDMDPVELTAELLPLRLYTDREGVHTSLRDQPLTKLLENVLGIATVHHLNPSLIYRF